MARLTKAERDAVAFKGWATRRAIYEQVAANLPAHLLPLWDRVKYLSIGTVDERTEAFLQYVHDRQGEEVQAIIEDADAKVEALIREYESRPEPECPF